MKLLAKLCCILSISFFGVNARAQQKIANSKFLLSFNVGNTLLQRPQLSAELPIGKFKIVELTVGYLLQSERIHQAMVPFSGDDSFLTSGIFVGTGLKRMISSTSYFGALTYYKNHSYSNVAWKNEVPEGEEGSFSVISSNHKKQLALSVIFGKYISLRENLFLDFFYGVGLIHNSSNFKVHEKLYDYSLHFQNRSAPFEDAESGLSPIVNFGIKLGLRVKKDE